MATFVEIPGVGEVEFPDSMDENQITAAVQGFMDQNPVSGVVSGIADKAQGYAGQAADLVGNAANWAMGGSPTGPDYMSGVPGHGFHGGFGKRDTDEERQTYLNAQVGENNWYQDAQGEYLIRPEGLKKLGLDPGKYGNRPVEMTGAGLRAEDVTRWSSGAWGPMLGGLLGGGVGALMGAPTGGLASPLLAAGGSGIGATLGKGVQEGVEHLFGENQQSAADVGKDMTVEGVYGAIPIPAAQAALGGAAKKATAPLANRLLPENEQLMKEAQQMGVQPAIHQVVPDAGLVGRSAGIAKRIFPWSRREQRNIRALQNEVADVVDDLPLAKSAEEAGRSLRAALQEGQEGFQQWAQRDLYDPLRARVGGGEVPVVPTQRVRDAATDLLGGLTTTKEGKRLTLGKQEYGLLDDFSKLKDNISLDEVWTMRSRLRELEGNPVMRQTIPQSVIKKLDSALAGAMGDIPEHGAAAAATARVYQKAVNIRKDKLFDQMLREGGDVGGISDRDMIDRVFVPKGGETIARLWRNIPADRKAGVQRGAFEKLVTEVTKGTESIQDFISAGPKLLSVLQKYERPTLVQMFGADKTNQLFKLGRVMELNARKNKDYGALVAASIAARPVANIGKMGQFRALNNLYESPFGLKMFTEGLDFLSKKGQVTEAFAKGISDLAIHGAMGTGEGAQGDRGSVILDSASHLMPPPETIYEALPSFNAL